jgi:hypothetical protein
LVTASKRTSGRMLGSAQGAKPRLIAPPAPGEAIGGRLFSLLNTGKKTSRAAWELSYFHPAGLATSRRPPHVPVLRIAPVGNRPLTNFAIYRRYDDGTRTAKAISLLSLVA